MNGKQVLKWAVGFVVAICAVVLLRMFYTWLIEKVPSHSMDLGLASQSEEESIGEITQTESGRDITPIFE